MVMERLAHLLNLYTQDNIRLHVNARDDYKMYIIIIIIIIIIITSWPDSASELYRPSYRRLSAKLVPTFADGGCHVVIVTDPYGRILGFVGRKRVHIKKYIL
jgi:hypothetical protein